MTTSQTLLLWTTWGAAFFAVIRTFFLTREIQELRARLSQLLQIELRTLRRQLRVGDEE